MVRALVCVHSSAGSLMIHRASSGPNRGLFISHHFLLLPSFEDYECASSKQEGGQVDVECTHNYEGGQVDVVKISTAGVHEDECIDLDTSTPPQNSNVYSNGQAGARSQNECALV